MTAAGLTDEEAADRFEAWADRVDPADLVEIDTECLRRLTALGERRAAAQQQEAALEAEIADAAAQASAAGHPWAVIALCLGVSRQAAHKRYAAPRPAPAAEPGTPQPRRGKGARGGQYIPRQPAPPGREMA